MKKYIVIIPVLLGSTARAENWVGVGLVTPVNVELYADKDSVKRTGDLATVIVKAASFKEALETKDQVRFNCVKEVIIGYDEEFPITRPLSGKGITWSPAMMQRLFNVACKKWFEFWK